VPHGGERRGFGLFSNDFSERGQIVCVSREKFEAWIFERGREIFAAAKFQVVNARDARAAGKQGVHEMAADESGGTGDETIRLHEPAKLNPSRRRMSRREAGHQGNELESGNPVWHVLLAKFS